MNDMLEVRIDDDLKNQATMVYEELGIDLSTAIRMFLKKSVAVNGIPFDTKNDSSIDKAMAAINAMRQTSADNGNDELSLDEINEIIDEVRKNKNNH